MLNKLKTVGIYLGGTIVICGMIAACIGGMMFFSDHMRCLGPL